jgi:short-subunit dehydrogenase
MSVPPRYALVAAGSSGIGKAMAHRLARSGYNLILVSDRDMELTLAQIELAHAYPSISIETFSADLGVPLAAFRLYEAVSRRHSEIEVLVNESWTGEADPTQSNSLAAQLRAIRINVEAFATLTQRVAQDMVAAGNGRILTIGHVHPAGVGGVTQVYPATCAFVEHFSRDLSEQLVGTGVTVTCLRADMRQRRRPDSDPIALSRDPEHIADLAFDGLMRGDTLVALDGSFKTPIIPQRVVA